MQGSARAAGAGDVVRLVAEHRARFLAGIIHRIHRDHEVVFVHLAHHVKAHAAHIEQVHVFGEHIFLVDKVEGGRPYPVVEHKAVTHEEHCDALHARPPAWDG